MSDKVYDIKEAAVYMSKNEQYVRLLIRTGKLATNMVRVPGTRIMKHVMTQQVLDEYMKKTSVHTVRQDGRSKNTIYMTTNERELVNKFCEEHNIPLPFLTNEGMYDKRKQKKLQEQEQ